MEQPKTVQASAKWKRRDPSQLSDDPIKIGKRVPAKPRSCNVRVIMQIPGIIWLHVRVEAEPVSLVVTTFAVTRGGDPAFYDTRLVHRISACERANAGRKGEHRVPLAVGNRRSGVSASGELDFPRVSVGTSIRSFVRSFVWLTGWVVGWLAGWVCCRCIETCKSRRAIIDPTMPRELFRASRGWCGM